MRPEPTKPERAPTSAAAGFALVVWLVGSFVGTAWLIDRGFRDFVVEPRCETACAVIGQHQIGLHIGGRGRGATACLCDGGGSVETSAPDLGAAIAVALGLLLAYGSTLAIARRRR